MTQVDRPSGLQRLFKSLAAVEPFELKAVILSMLYFFFLFGSYSVVKPVRDAMGTVYGISHIQELFTGTFIASFIFAPLYAGLASRLKLSTFLPWVYGFVAVSILVFYALFAFGAEHDRGVAAAFYIWVSTFNMLIISVFWTFMADIFSRTQAKRLFGFIAAGGFVVTAFIVVSIAGEKERLMAASGGEAQRTTLNHRLGGGNPFDGFVLLMRSPYLLWVALFLLLMTWISTIVYIQLGDLITKAFPSREARTQAYASIDLVVNSAAVVLQLFGTGRIISRFGVKTGLLLNPIIMVVAFLAIVFSPVLMVLGSIQVIRRVAEYAIAKPTREMLFTVVDQESKYKAKNVIDTVVYRFGDLSAAWIGTALLPFGIAGLAIFGAVVSAVWFPIAYLLGKRYETARGEEGAGAGQEPVRAH
jgi:ATP:ADP antiporter, AAA family